LVVWWNNKNIWFRKIGGMMRKKLFILIAFLFNLVYSASPSGLECNVCYFPKPISCPAQCNLSVSCSTSSGSGYECVDFKWVNFEVSGATGQKPPTLIINFYPTLDSCTSSPITSEASQRINAYPPSGCKQNTCYNIESDCGKALLELASTKEFPASKSEILIPKELITTSLLIIFVEVSALAIVYAIGKAFSYEKLVTYSRGELTQALANIILIAILFSTFLSINIYGLIQSLQSQFNSIKGEVINYATNLFIWNAYASTVAAFTFDEARLTISIPVIPPFVSINLIMGLNKIQIIDGIAPFLDVIDRLFSFFSYSFIFIIATQIFLFNFITEMFPILLYLGLLLRVVPWTRSAGGYLISFFIGFYFFYPLLLTFFFSLDTFRNIQLQANVSSLSYLAPYPNVAILEGFTTDILNLAIKFILPIILCFIVSLMLVEEFGILLGSFLTKPSLFRVI
jgi:hypothetical protein